MFNALPFLQLSPARQRLVRLCQSTNYGYIQDLLIKDGDPVLVPGPAVLVDIKLDFAERPRLEVDSADFLLCAETTRQFELIKWARQFHRLSPRRRLYAIAKASIRSSSCL